MVGYVTGYVGLKHGLRKDDIDTKMGLLVTILDSSNTNGVGETMVCVYYVHRV